jgi:hypothetical protein
MVNVEIDVKKGEKGFVMTAASGIVNMSVVINTGDDQLDKNVLLAMCGTFKFN